KSPGRTLERTTPAMTPTRPPRLAAAFAIAMSLLASRAAAEELPAQLLYRRTVAGTAFIINSDADKTGSGWVVSRPQRLVVTNFHVVAKNEQTVATVKVLFPAYRGGRVIGEMEHYRDLVKQNSAAAITGRVVYSEAKRDLVRVQVSGFGK